jgi:CRP-like cAMP-binding protein
MNEQVITTAFNMGIISACSLPLGALTALFWKPGDRVAAALVAFGGGALLAALTLDLVAPAFARGHYFWLASGCTAGGLLFVALNEIINDYGGFLRKASTTIYHLRRQEHRRFRRILSNLQRIDIFHNLPHEDFKRVADAMGSYRCERGASPYHLGDSPDTLYIIADGEMELRDPQQNMERLELLDNGSAFARMAVLTGMPHATLPVATRDTELWTLRRKDLDTLLENSPWLRQSAHRWLRSEEVSTYLRSRQQMDVGQTAAWIEAAITHLGRKGHLPPMVQFERREREFCAITAHIRHSQVLEDLPPGAAEAVASRLLYKHFARGETFYKKGDRADRMYVIARGEVSEINLDDLARRQTLLHDHDAIGGMAFLTGARHASVAVATSATDAWVLRRQDFLELLQTQPELERRVRECLENRDVAAYLESRQDFDSNRAFRWVHTAIRNLDTGRLIPAAEEMAARMRTIKGAPLAIWLGILLDGIPESLVIGASLAYHEVSLALIAGLFLSNYPEALFSSIGMRQQGFTITRVITMWTSLMILTGVGAALGSLFFVGADGATLSMIEGLAAGAMLTMIAQTMLPDAYFKGGSVIGLATLMGFLAALFFKSI